MVRDVARRVLVHLQDSRVYRSVVWPLLPKPFESPFMEVTHGAWAGVFSARDCAGRQLGEGNVTPALFRCPQTATRWKRWKAPGPRQGFLFNVCALRQVTSLWPEVLQLSLGLRRAFLTRFPERGPRLTPGDLFVVALILTAIPGFRLRRGSCRDGEIPEVVAATYKAAAGVHFSVRNMLASGLPSSVVSGEEVFAFIERERLLFSPQGRVCSGPRRLIVDYLSALIEGGESSVEDESFEYGVAAARLEFSTMAHCLAAARLLQADPRSAGLPDLEEYRECAARFGVLVATGERYWDLAAERRLWQAHDYESLTGLALDLFQARHEEIAACLGLVPGRVRREHIRHRIAACVPG